MVSAPPHPLTSHTVTSVAQLRALIGEPAELTASKISDRLNRVTRLFIERSPFVCVATSDAAGRCDVSPRGDPPGFVRILDDRTLLLPERPGNRLADSLLNLLANPHIGLLFVVPGATDTFRVNGRATVTVDAALLAPCTVEGKERGRQRSWPALGLQGGGGKAQSAARGLFPCKLCNAAYAPLQAQPSGPRRFRA